MVQQLSLTAQVPSSKVERLLLTLQTLTGNVYSNMNQHSVILKPRYPFTPEPVAGSVVQIESYRVRMNRLWESGHPKTFRESLKTMKSPGLETETGTTVSGDSITKQSGRELSDSIWTLQLSDIPAGGKNPVLVQNIYETTIYETDDVIGYLDELGYMHETEFWSNGVRFYYGDVIVELCHMYVLDNGKRSGSTPDEAQKSEPNTGPASTLSSLKLFDQSGTCNLKAFVNIGRLNDIESISLGTNQLEALKRELSELVELHIPDRTMMDSRLNSRIATSSLHRKQ